MSHTITFTYENDDGEELVGELPAVYEVCGRCEGEGCHLTPSIGDHAYTMEEFREAFDDEESREQYFRRGGIYDVQCEECKGKRVVLVVNEEECKSSPALTDLLEIYYNQEADKARWNAEDAYTRRMENGGYDY